MYFVYLQFWIFISFFVVFYEICVSFKISFLDKQVFEINLNISTFASLCFCAVNGDIFFSWISVGLYIDK